MDGTWVDRTQEESETSNDDDYQNVVNINEIDLSDPNFVQGIFVGSTKIRMICSHSLSPAPKFFPALGLLSFQAQSKAISHLKHGILARVVTENRLEVLEALLPTARGYQIHEAIGDAIQAGLFSRFLLA